MNNPLRALVRSGGQRSEPSPFSIPAWLESFSFGGLNYPVMPSMSMAGEKQEKIAASFQGYATQAYQSDGVVFACMLVRLLLFSEVRFQFRKRENGRPGELFGTQALELLENPWPNGTTGDLAARAIQDVDLAGNFYGVRRDARTIKRLNPEWVTIVCGSRSGYEADMEVVGYIYDPCHGDDTQIQTFDVSEVCHWAPIPDPTGRYRGMSWITPVLREIMGDKAMEAHKLKFFEQGATPNLVVKFDKEVRQEAFDAWVDKIEAEHGKGIDSAYKTLYLGGGSDVTPIGGNLREVDFREVQGHGETRIAAAAGVPPVVVGLSEGLRAATYSNYQQAMRRLSDGTMRPLWRSFAASLAPIIQVPTGAELWYDDRDIPFLKEDSKDEAEINHVQAQAIQALTVAGFEPGSAVQAVVSGDLTKLKHTGLMSVQMWQPGKDSPTQPQPEGGGAPAEPKPSSNGNGNGKPVPALNP